MNQRHMDWIPIEITCTSAYASENAAKIYFESIKPNAEYFFKTCFEIPYVLDQTLEVDSFFLNLLCSLNDISSGRERSCNSAAVAIWFWDVHRVTTYVHKCANVCEGACKHGHVEARSWN